MSQGKIVKVLVHYIDAGSIERVISAFRRLLIDVDWIYGRRLDEEGNYEIYLLVREHPNFFTAIMNLSKTVGVESVEVYENGYIEKYKYEDGTFSKLENAKVGNSSKKGFIIYIPIATKIKVYSWGEMSGKDI